MCTLTHRAWHSTGSHAGVTAAAKAGYAVLARGGSAIDAVEAAVRFMEDDPHFNAGKGSVSAQ
jgi:beta-aspartyl-peptidase (threonine type)